MAGRHVFRRMAALMLAVLMLAAVAVCAGAEEAKDAEEKITLENIRDYVVGIDTPILLEDGTKRPLINFDNAATTPALRPVQEEVDKELEMYGSIGAAFPPNPTIPRTCTGKCGTRCLPLSARRWNTRGNIPFSM